MIDTLIFDAEGVVIDTESLWNTTEVEFLGARGIEYDIEVLKPILTGCSTSQAISKLKNMYGLSGTIDELCAERINIAKKLFKTQIKFIDGFEDFYAYINGSYKTCIATALSTDILDIVDAKLGLRQLFNNRVYTADDVNGVGKPEPDIFLYSAKQVNSDPGNCLVFEDAPYGIEAAIRAGMPCIGLATTFDKSLLSAANLVVDSYSEIDLDIV